MSISHSFWFSNGLRMIFATWRPNPFAMVCAAVSMAVGADAAKVGELSAVARSGSVAVSKGEVTLSSFDRHYRLSG